MTLLVIVLSIALLISVIFIVTNWVMAKLARHGGFWIRFEVDDGDSD